VRGSNLVKERIIKHGQRNDTAGREDATEFGSPCRMCVPCEMAEHAEGDDRIDRTVAKYGRRLGPNGDCIDPRQSRIDQCCHALVDIQRIQPLRGDESEQHSCDAAPSRPEVDYSAERGEAAAPVLSGVFVRRLHKVRSLDISCAIGAAYELHLQRLRRIRRQLPDELDRLRQHLDRWRPGEWVDEIGRVHVRHGQLLGKRFKQVSRQRADRCVPISAAIIYATITTDLAALVMGGRTTGWRP